MSYQVINALDTKWYKCPKCKRSFFVKEQDPQLHLLKKSMRCPNYIRCKGHIANKSWTKAGEIRNWKWASAIELYQASAGLGFESERDCSPDTIKEFITGARIVASEVIETGDPKKSVLLSLTLDNGKTIHLASSTTGAVIYKITMSNNDR